jgi:hypothetical protein
MAKPPPTLAARAAQKRAAKNSNAGAEWCAGTAIASWVETDAAGSAATRAGAAAANCSRTSVVRPPAPRRLPPFGTGRSSAISKLLSSSSGGRNLGISRGRSRRCAGFGLGQDRRRGFLIEGIFGYGSDGVGIGGASGVGGCSSARVNGRAGGSCGGSGLFASLRATISRYAPSASNGSS